MDPLAARVDANLRRMAPVPDGASLVVAVSGGMDSVVLLEILRRLAPARGWKLTVAHLDHGIRGLASRQDAQFVQKLARSLRLPIDVAKASVPALARRRGDSLEVAARTARHQFLSRIRRNRSAFAVALAHHLDDQIELFFLRLFRGSGGLGLGGMTWSATSPFDPKTRLIRPLLDVPRDEIEGFARSNGLAWREDATNFDLSIPRNRIRHELVPLLLGSYCPGLRTTLPRTMEILRADAEHVAEADPRSQSGSQPSLAQLRVAARRELQMAGRPVNFRNIQARIDSKAAVPRKQKPPGALRHDRHEAWRVILNSDPRRVRTGTLRVSWAFRRDPLPFAVGAGRYEQFDADVVGDPVELRHWRPGDRFHMLGKRQASKLQDLFTGRKIPPAQRHERMVALDSAGRVFWVEGLPPGEAQKLTATTRRVLVWKWDRSAQ